MTDESGEYEHTFGKRCKSNNHFLFLQLRV